MSVKTHFSPVVRAAAAVSLIVASVLTWTASRPSAHGQVVPNESDDANVVISGRVLNPQGKALPGTPVYLFLKGEAEPRRVFADPKGRYRFEIDQTLEIPMLLFDNQDWHVRVVEEISGQYNSEINKILPVKEGPKTFALIVDQIMVYDRLRIDQYVRGQWVQDQNVLAERRAQFRTRFGARVLNIPHPLRRVFSPPYVWAQGQVQREVIDKLTPAEQMVIDRLLGDLLWRVGYLAEPITFLPPGVGLPVIVPMPPATVAPEPVPATPDLSDIPMELPAGATAAPVGASPAPSAPVSPVNPPAPPSSPESL